MKDKINKLLALAKSSNQHEAEAAMAKAAALMQEHQLSHLDLLPDPEVTHTDYVEIVKQHFIWGRTLAGAAAMMFDCRVVQVPWKDTFYFVGEKENLNNAQMLFWHLFKAWKTICNQDYTTDRPANRQLYRKSHGLAYATVLYARAKVLTEKRKEAIIAATNGTNLVVIHQNKVQDYMNEVLGTVSAKSRSLKVSVGGQEAGKRAGSKVVLNAPIQNNTRLLK